MQKASDAKSRSLVVEDGEIRSLSLAEQLELDSVQNILFDGEDRLLSTYKTLAYYMYIKEVVDGDGYEFDDDEEFAQKLMLAQGTVTLSKIIKGSPFESFVKNTWRKLRRVRDATTVQVTRTEYGSFDVSRDAEVEENLLEFKLHASPKRGIEPRITILDRFILSHDFLANSTQLEYEFEF